MPISPPSTLVYPGSTVTASVQFKVSSVLTDPTSVTLSVRSPAGIVINPTPVHDSVGNYHYNVVVAPGQAYSGRWWVRWDGDGTVDSAVEDYFDVTASQF